MATKQVNIDIIAKDKTRMAMQSATRGVDKLKSSVFNLRNALLGLGAGFIAKGFLDTAREVERLRVRFKFLFDDAREGAKAFNSLVKFAGQVPFSLQEIQRGSANLAVVSKNADELNTLLKITGDIASASGLDFATTAEQIQRTFSSGINSADLFRERGVKALLGFEAGVKISAEQSREHILNAFRDGTLAVVGASEDMAKTFDGTLSMIGDKVTRFQLAVMDSAPFEFLKKAMMLVERELEKNFGSIEKAGEKFGKTLVEGFKDILIGSAKVLDFLTPMFSFLTKSIVNLVNLAQSVPAPFDTLGILGFLMLGRKGKALILLIGGFMDNIRSGLGSILDTMIDIEEFSHRFGGSLFMTDEEKKKFNDNMKSLRERVKELKTPLAEIDDTAEKSGDSITLFGKKFSSTLDLGIEKSDKFEKMVRKFLKSIEGTKEIDKVFPENFVDIGMGDEIDNEIQKVGMLQQAYQSFGVGFMEAVNKQKDGFKQIEDIGKATFGKLKQTLTDFVMTGKLNFADLGRFVVRMFIEMLIGEAVKMAFAKSMAMFKADAIKRAMINLFAGAMETFKSIPFPLNIVAVGGALAFGASLVNKIKGFADGGRPPVGRPSIVGEKGAELFVPDQAGTIVPNDKLGMGQPVTVNFNINTVDARGFNELLVNSRGVIINMINQAVNEKGKMAIV